MRCSSPPSLTPRARFFLFRGALDRQEALFDAHRVQSRDDAIPQALKSAEEGERRAALSELRGFVRGALSRTFRRQLSEVDLDDLTQDSLLRVLSRLDDFQQQSRFTTWATAIAVNCALSELRRRRYRHVTIDDAMVEGHAALTQDPPPLSDGAEQTLGRLRQGIAQALTERQREATLARLGGLPLSEIARRQGTSPGAVYKMLHDARRRLKAFLEGTEPGSDESLVTSAGST
jgi:RNA polymerase sigma-70 factor, ECF subfamily